jgi:uncharacterized protein YegP (UPF0339 family)
MATGRFEVYRDLTGRFRFRLLASNGQVLASGKACPTRAAAEKGCRAVQRAADGAPIVHR